MPQRVKRRGVPLWCVEPLNEARTPLADCFSSLLFIPLRLLVDPEFWGVGRCLVGLAKPQDQMGVL